MKLYQVLSLSSLLFASVLGGKSGSSIRQQQVPISVPVSGPSSPYSQPIPSVYATPSGSARQDQYAYSQPIAQASTQAEYYQPVEQAYVGVGGYGQQGYPRQAQAGGHQQPAYYEPVHQGSGHYPVKRGHQGHGWHPQASIETILFIGIPLIILPLLFIYPYFLYAASHHRHHPVVYAGGWKRSSDGKAPVEAEGQKKKVEELTEKILPKLEKSS